MPTKDGEEEDIFEPYYSHLTPIEIEAFRVFEAVRVQNKFLIRENILLEEHINTLRRVIRRLEYLLSLKCDASSPPPSSSPPPKETLAHGYGHSSWLEPSLGEVPRYRITITFIHL